MTEYIKIHNPKQQGASLVLARRDFDPAVHTLFDEPMPLRTDGPTLEEYVAAGYLAKNYPPSGYAEKPSAGLDAYRDELKQADAKADADRQAREDAARRENEAARAARQAAEASSDAAGQSTPVAPPADEPKVEAPKRRK